MSELTAHGPLIVLEDVENLLDAAFLLELDDDSGDLPEKLRALADTISRRLSV